MFVVGEAGLTMLTYNGWLDDDYYVGEITGATYKFGLERRKGFVDTRDVEGMLKVIEDTQEVFSNGSNSN